MRLELGRDMCRVVPSRVGVTMSLVMSRVTCIRQERQRQACPAHGLGSEAGRGSAQTVESSSVPSLPVQTPALLSSALFPWPKLHTLGTAFSWPLS